MAKAIVIELTDTIPDTEQNKVVTVTIEDRTYTGKLTTIITYNLPPEVPASGTVILTGPGLGAQ